MKNPYEVIIKRHITEKSSVLEQLHTSESNSCSAACKRPKFVFIVDRKANKKEIALAVEQMFKEQSVKVKAVNTLTGKRKPKKRGRMRKGATAAFKKAVVTLEEGDSLDNV